MSHMEAKQARKQARRMVGIAGLDALTEHRAQLNQLAVLVELLGRELTAETTKLRAEIGKLRDELLPCLR